MLKSIFGKRTDEDDASPDDIFELADKDLALRNIQKKPRQSLRNLDYCGIIQKQLLLLKNQILQDLHWSSLAIQETILFAFLLEKPKSVNKFYFQTDFGLIMIKMFTPALSVQSTDIEIKKSGNCYRIPRMVRVEVVETSSHPWEGYIIAVIRYPQQLYDSIKKLPKWESF